MPTMPDRVHSAYEAEMYDARTASTHTGKWDHLELAHLLVEPYPWPHVRTHLTMLALALRLRDRREVTTQLAAVVAVVTSRGGREERCHARDVSRQVRAPFAHGSR